MLNLQFGVQPRGAKTEEIDHIPALNKRQDSLKLHCFLMYTHFNYRVTNIQDAKLDFSYL